MKRATALRYAREIARRLHEVNGLLATPVCKHEAVRVEEALRWRLTAAQLRVEVWRSENSNNRRLEGATR